VMPDTNPRLPTANPPVSPAPNRPSRAIRLLQTVYLALHGFCVVLLLGAIPVRYGQLAGLAPPALPPGWTPEVLMASLNRVNLSPERYAYYSLALELFLAAVYIGIAWSVARRATTDGPSLLVAISLLLAGSALLPVLPALASLHPAMQTLVLMLRAAALVCLAALFYVFPTGQFVPRWSRWLLVVWAGYQFSAAYFYPLALPLAVSAVTSPVAWMVLVLNLGWLTASGMAQLHRFRQQHQTEPLPRQQIKWLLLGAILSGLGSFMVLLPLWLLRTADLPGVLGVVYLVAATPAVTLALLAWPISISAAAQRRWLWEVDFVINRTLVYGPVMLLLLLLLAGSLYFLTLVLPEEPMVTFATAAVLAGILFQPLRHWLQPIVDRRMYGIRADYHLRSPASEPLPELPQRRLGAYKLLEPIQFGGLGRAYRAHAQGGGKSVVVKVLPRRYAADAHFREVFEQAMAAAACVEHPHLARVLEAGQAENSLYVVSEYLVGQDLSSFLLINGRLSVSRALPILRDLASGLDMLHERGQVHGDVRLANVMLVLRSTDGGDRIARDARFPARAAFLPTTAFRTVLLNHGLSHLLNTGRHVEALGYVAPEQIQAGQVDGRADVYSLGALAYLLVAGVLPFQHRNASALAIAHLKHVPPDPRGRVPSLSAATAQALCRALSKDPAERFATAGEFVAALR
jgi:hypothetical protein